MLEKLIQKARNIIVRQEIAGLQEMEATLYEAESKGEDTKKHLQNLGDEVERLKRNNTFDHEEVFIATGQYTTGRTSHPKVKWKK